MDLTGYKIILDERLEGEKSAEINEEVNEIRLSPAMFKLWQTDRDELMKILKVRILSASSKSGEK